MHNAGQSVGRDEALHDARHSEGAECSAEVAIPGAQAVEGAGEMLCSTSTAAV
jgi:hypothetical protein